MKYICKIKYSLTGSSSPTLVSQTHLVPNRVEFLFSSLVSDILSGYSCVITSGYKQCHLPIHPVPDNTTKQTPAGI
ncbi:hypothetical protein EB796_014542 [Bugula neritina]|uniref:Uncharacterized protein n=1 Tax=Bugula neritina TaxID=10212 RepID=A0A7J7JLD2_BUGNE|nr:hypothetical protein EB796_014542 [Bugula neritina]